MCQKIIEVAVKQSWTERFGFSLNGRLGHLTNLSNWLNIMQTGGSQ